MSDRLTASQSAGLTLDVARAIVSAVLAAAREMGVAMSCAVVDSGDQLVAFERMDGADLVTITLAKDKAYEEAQSAKDRTNDKTGAVKEKASEATQSAKEKASGAAQTTKEKGQAGKEETGGILEKTGEQMKSMAQGVTETVKSTFGMAGENE